MTGQHDHRNGASSKRLSPTVLRWIVWRRDAGDTFAEIASTLTRRRVPTTTGKTLWHPATVQRAVFLATSDSDEAVASKAQKEAERLERQFISQISCNYTLSAFLSGEPHDQQSIRNKIINECGIDVDARLGNGLPVQGRVSMTRVRDTLVGDPCGWCGTPWRDDFHIDHIVPLARGGTNEACNLVASCARCNLSKGAKDWGRPRFPGSLQGAVAKRVDSTARLRAAGSAAAVEVVTPDPTEGLRAELEGLRRELLEERAARAAAAATIRELRDRVEVADRHAVELNVALRHSLRARTTRRPWWCK